MDPSFWKKALASLPPQEQWRYAAAFEAAERIERIVDLAWDAGRQALALGCRLAARALEVTSRLLDSAARRLVPSR